MNNDITDVPGIKVGHAQSADNFTGVTVVLPPPSGARAGIHVGGSAPSTRQMDSLNPLHIVDRIHAVCLCGGSAFGLDAAGGVLAGLEADKVGFQVVGVTVPIVPTAAIFDLNFGSGKVRPDFALGLSAYKNAGAGPIAQGSVGVGAGATIGKLLGMDCAMKGGVGSASVQSGDIIVGAIVAANPFGDVLDRTGRILAGVRAATDSAEFADAARLLETGRVQSRSLAVENTTLAVIATNALLDKPSAVRVAAQATLGLGRVIRPFHSHIDGDLTIVMSVGDVGTDANRIALLAQQALQDSVHNAVRFADGLGILPAWRDLNLR